MGLEVCKETADAIKAQVRAVLKRTDKFSNDSGAVKYIKTVAENDALWHEGGVPFEQGGGRAVKKTSQKIT